MSLPVLPYPAPGADPECFAAAARYVQREYGDGGYRMALEGCGGARAVFRVSHYDGSEFRVLADVDANAWTLPEVDDLGAALAIHNEPARERAARPRTPCCAPEMCPECWDDGGHLSSFRLERS